MFHVVYGVEDLGAPAALLLDEHRMRSFAEALAASVRPGDVVVDVGAGLGVLTLLCAKAGARRVYALERGPSAAVINEAVRDNDFDDVVAVERGPARDVIFDAPPTLIVSASLGAFGTDSFWASWTDVAAVRARAAAECRVLPGLVSCHAALAEVPALARELARIGDAGVKRDGDGNGVKLGAVRARLVQRPVVAHVDAATLLGASTVGAQLMPGDAVPQVIATSTSCARSGLANAIVCWFEAVLGPGLTLSSSPSAPVFHAGQLVLPLDPPIPVSAGAVCTAEVRPRVIAQRSSYAWAARCGTETRRGDAMQALVGDMADIKVQLGVTRSPT